MGVRGDFAGLAQLRAQLSKLGSPSGRDGMIRVCAEAAVKQLDDQFRQSRDPYGTPWKPLSSRAGQPLRDTGQLLNSLAPRVVAGGFVIATNRTGAATHQYGALIRAKTSKGLRFRVGGARAGKGSWVTKQQVTIPKRQYIPEGDLGKWGPAIFKAAEDYMATSMGKGT